MSCTPASWRRRLTAGEATRPVPRGAGISYLRRVVFSVDYISNSRPLVVGERKESGRWIMKWLGGKVTYPDRNRSTFATLLGRQRMRVT